MRPDSTQPLPPSLDEWFREHPEADKDRLEATWKLVEIGRYEMTEADQRTKSTVWAALERHINEAEPETESPSVTGPVATGRPPLRRHRPRPLLWVAAAATVALIFGLGYFFRTTTVTAPRGEFAQVTLPDGSQVQLNSESVVTYRPHFLGARTVRLEGEAFFEVTRDDRRFVVETFNARTTVLGTEFNVRARSDEPQASTSVVVATGKVRLLSKNGDDKGVILTSGTQSSVAMNAPRPTIPQMVPLSRRLAWRTGGLAFSDQPFSLIFQEIERRYDVEIEAAENILNRSFSYYVHDPKSAANVISDLVTAEGLRYRKTSQGFEVYRP